MNDFFVLLDDALNACTHRYHDYVRADFLCAADIDHLDDCLATGQAHGWYAVLLADYALGEALHDMGEEGTLALYWFAGRDTGDAAQGKAWPAETDDSTPAGVAAWSADTDKTAYLQAVAAVQAAIARGETYQINHTFRLHFTAYGQPAALYRRLRARQAVPYGALAHLPDVAGDTFWLLSYSPELFVRFDGRTVTAEPMKGTAAILDDGQDEARRQALQQDDKNRAENVMIVDLLRNDLGKIAQTGSVAVPQRFAVHAFGKVWQMTSTVTARLREGVRAADIIRAVYPCGSITGAPKRRSMAMIRALESSPRGYYTGSLGFLTKTDDGFSGCLNVLIRTLTLRPQAGAWRGQMGVGSGIVADSHAGEEWAECALKAGFVRDLPPTFSLIETLRFEQGRCPLAARHLDRLCASAQTLGFVCKRDHIAEQLRHHAATLPATPQRVRLLLHPSGACTISGEALPPLPATGVRVVMADTPLPDDWLRRHKTTARKVYDAGLRQAQACGAFDMLYCNAAGELLEGARSNIFVKIHGIWHTPPRTLAILPGVMRDEILARPQLYLATDVVRETVLRREDLRHAEAVLVCNALRGALPVTHHPSDLLRKHST